MTLAVLAKGLRKVPIKPINHEEETIAVYARETIAMYQEVDVLEANDE